MAGATTTECCNGASAPQLPQDHALGVLWPYSLCTYELRMLPSALPLLWPAQQHRVLVKTTLQTDSMRRRSYMVVV